MKNIGEPPVLQVTDPRTHLLTDVEALNSTPMVQGRSKTLYDLGDGRVLVRLVPSLHSFTFGREAMMPGTDKLRLDFYERAAAKLAEAGIACAFESRVDETAYIARYCPGPPFEVIVKNVAAGSTIRKYPGLFAPGTRFAQPVVKFDFRADPEDIPIADDYLREYGYDVAAFRGIALATNEVLRNWLAPNDLWDFCVIVGADDAGKYWITSEVSPDGMRLKRPDGSSLDKDLFRQGEPAEKIMAAWKTLIDGLR
jgi:phosphoribosylaminoimidazole-succinocarboxamide synthase